MERMTHRLLKFLLWPALMWRRKLQARKETQFEAYHKRLLQHVEEGNVVVSVPDFDGSFEIDIRSNIFKRILKRGHYESDLARIVRSRVDRRRDAIDVGANVGFFTILLAKTVQANRRILAAEPAPLALKYLHGNIQRNRVSKMVTVYEGVLVDRPGSLTLNVIPGKEEYSSVFAIAHPSVKGATSVAINTEGDTLDNIVRHLALEPGFIKIDAEGAEHMVLQGARETLGRWRPVVLCEVSDILLSQSSMCSQDIIRLLESYGYTIVIADCPSQVIRSPFVGEILAVPREEANAVGSTRAEPSIQSGI